MDVRPFAIEIRPDVIDDLYARLDRTRWFDDRHVEAWEAGTDASVLRTLVHRWRHDYDWSDRVAGMNAHPRFEASIEGTAVRFVHRRAARAGALPLLLCHGWPDSSWRYRRVVDRLAAPASTVAGPEVGFDVVVPDMPGFGWSEPARDHDIDTREVARRWSELMTALGYSRYGVAGGDMGSHVARWLALDHPDAVVAVHRTDAGLPASGVALDQLSPEERAWVAEVTAWGAREGAYAAVHRTKPQTVAAGLTDSPVGLASWIVEKLHAWSDGGLDAYAPDDVLDLLTEYWVTGTIGSSMRMYRANAAIPPDQLERRVETPSGFSLFAGDIVRPPRQRLERLTNLVFCEEPPRGGHFAPFEQPDAYADQLRRFFRPWAG